MFRHNHCLNDPIFVYPLIMLNLTRLFSKDKQGPFY